MKITKSELRKMIRECLREELNEGAYNGGQAEGGFRDTYARPGGHTRGSGTNHKALEGKKTKTVLAKDLKPGMVTNTGEVKKVTSTGWDMGGNHKMVEISYGGIGVGGSHASDNVREDKEYEVLDESLTEAAAMDWDSLIAAADDLLSKLIAVTGNDVYDDSDGYWSGEEGHVWCNRYMYYTDKLNSYADLERLCAEYSDKLPNVTFYYIEEDLLGDAVSEIGYEATNVDYVED